MTTALPHDPHTNLRRSLRTTAERTLADARLLDSPHRSSSSTGATGLDEGVDSGGVDGVGVTVVVDGESVFVGANAFTDKVDEVQYELGEGPCLSAVAAGRIVTSRRIGTTERRWSLFTPRAAALDLRGVSSAPMTSGDVVVGSVNVYSRTPDGLTSIPPKVLLRLAAAAETALSSARLLAQAESGAQRLAQVLDARAVIERAVGLLMDRYLMTANQARTLLAQLARHDDTTDAAAARTLTDPGPIRRPDAAEGLGRPDAPDSTA